ncbi:MAG: hypothetical protein K2O89_00405 [Clostridia bacterium]|nr:hypothetical protein [Clostridia bacterium]
MKKRFGVVALAAAAGCAVIFAGCTGCGSNGKANEAAFSSNWYADTSFRYIQPKFVGAENAEVLKYGVKFDGSAAGNTSYSVNYADGTYTTSFYATTFNKNIIDEDYRDAYPDNLQVYCYATELEIPSVTFTVGEDSKTFDGNTVQTLSFFLDVSNHLQPLYSEQHISMVSPTDYQVSKLEDAYLSVKQDIKTSYKYDGTAAKTVIEGDDATEFTTNDLNKTDNSLVDVCGLNIAVRAMQLGSGMSQVISVYSPAGKMQNYTFAGSSSALSEDERKAYETILEGKNLYVSGEDKTLNTVCVTATLNADMRGVSQKYWFAAIDNAKNNRGRATMVKMSVPLTFSLGTLNYTLEEIQSTLY